MSQRRLAHTQTGRIHRPLACRTRRDTLVLLLLRGHLDGIKRMMVGDTCMGRDTSQRGLGRSTWWNNFKVAEYGREVATGLSAQKLQNDHALSTHLCSLSEARVVCRCIPSPACHADGNARESLGTSWTTPRQDHRLLPSLTTWHLYVKGQKLTGVHL